MVSLDLSKTKITVNFLLKALGFDPKRYTIRTEVVAGLTTFLTMCYILAVNPSVLSSTGMDKGAVFTATALASGIGTLLIAFLAKLPFAQAPSMGISAFFAFTLVMGLGYTWQQALAAVFVEGIIFIILTLLNIREQIVKSIPLNLRYAISAGIGMFIAFIGLKNSGVIVAHPATLVTLGDFTPTALLACIGIVLSASLVALKVRGAIFYSIVVCTLVGIPLGVTTIPEGFTPIALPESLEPTFLQLDFSSLLNLDMCLTIAALVFMDMFDTIGTLIGAASKTELMDEEGNVKNIKPAMLSDAIATSVGAVLGTSTVATFVESASGIAEGGRTGLTAFTTGMLFLLALFCAPLFLLVPAAATTGALVLVGVFMLQSIQEVKLSDMSEALPSFVTTLTMVLTYNIAEGMSLGMISYTFVKLLSGKWREVSPMLYVITILMLCRYIFR